MPAATAQEGATDVAVPGPSPAGAGHLLRRPSFLAVNAGYLAATTAESLLAPVLPLASRELRLSVGDAGLALACLAAAIAVGNLAGGVALVRLGPRAGAMGPLLVAAAAALLVSRVHGRGPFLVGQALVGLGAGGFFASGLFAAGAMAGPGRRGTAMGLFGISFSAGLALAALLAALAGEGSWRLAFLASALVSLASAVALALVRLPGRPAPPPPDGRGSVRRLLGAPLAVGGTAAASQYGTVSFLPTFAVAVWGLSPQAAAAWLGVARGLSIAAKLLAGNRTDRRGARATAARTGLLLAAAGLAWTLLPAPWAALAAALVFAAAVSALGPVANTLALQGFGGRGALLGVFRSAQIAVGSVASAAIGAAASHVGLRPTLLVAAALPGALALIERRARGHRPPAVPAG